MKILLIEDDEQLAEVVSLNLKSQNYAVEQATDGQLGWELAEIANPDAIIVDCSLPRLDGFELCERLRAKGNGVPILMLTARDDIRDKIKGLDAGADDYLTKPFSLQELSARLRALLRRGNQLAGTLVLRWGSLTLTPSTCEVAYGDVPAALRPKEYALLELLMRNPKQVFNRDAILDRLWTFDDAPNEETVKAHVKGLRHHLKQAGAPTKLIETLYGMGYRLNPEYEHAEVETSPPASDPVEGSCLEIPAWSHLKPKMLERVEAIALAVGEIEKGAFESPLRQTGCMEVHKLAGILGTVGFDHGTALARQIEVQLKSELPSLVRLKQLLGDLERELEHDPTPKTLTHLDSFTQPAKVLPPTPDGDRPLDLLLVATNADIAKPVLQKTNGTQIRCIHVADVDSARIHLARALPDVMTLYLEGLSDPSETLGPIAKLVTTIPTLVVMDEVDLGSRVALASLGVKRILKASVGGDRLLTAVRQLGGQKQPQQASILAVDDDPEFLDILQGLLQPWNFAVSAIANAARAWEELEHLRPDLILLDVEMPDISGIELCQAIRSDERFWQVPVLILASLQNTDRVQQAFLAGADGFIKKPVVGAELIVRILNQLERQRTS